MHKVITTFPTVFRDESGRTYAILYPPKCPTCGEPATENLVHNPCGSDTWMCRKCSNASDEMYAGVWDTCSDDYLELPVECRCPICDTGKLFSRRATNDCIDMVCKSCGNEMDIQNAMTQFGRANVRIEEFATCGCTKEKPVIVQKLTPYERENLLDGLLERMRTKYHGLELFDICLSDINLLQAAVNCVRKMG